MRLEELRSTVQMQLARGRGTRIQKIQKYKNTKRAQKQKHKHALDSEKVVVVLEAGVVGRARQDWARANQMCCQWAGVGKSEAGVGSVCVSAWVKPGGTEYKEQRTAATATCPARPR